MHKIKTLITCEFNLFPEANLQDLYKLFFQDFFGPSHFISDIDTAKKYIKDELEIAGNHEPVILKQNIFCYNRFYRLDLRIIKKADDIEEYTKMFYDSSRIGLKNPCLWKEHWLNVKKSLKLIKPDLLDDVSLEAKLDQYAENDQQVRHSENYRELYKPHYRIIDGEILRNSRF